MADSLNNIAVIYLAKGEYEEAKQMFTEAVGRDYLPQGVRC